MNLKTWVHKNEIDRFVVGKEYRGIVFTGELITLTRCAGLAAACAWPHIKLLGCIRRSENINLSSASWLHGSMPSLGGDGCKLGHQTENRITGAADTGGSYMGLYSANMISVHI